MILRGSNIIQPVCNSESLLFSVIKDHQTWVAHFGGKHVMLRKELLLSMIALFVRIELLCSSFRRLPPNRANGVAVFKGSPIRNNNAHL